MSLASSTTGSVQVTLEPFASTNSPTPTSTSTSISKSANDSFPSSTPSLFSQSSSIVSSSSPMEIDSTNKATVTKKDGKDLLKELSSKDGKDKDKDTKYLENFLTSLSALPDFVRDKIGKIKGLEKAIMHKSSALKDASNYHVQMIHLKLTPKKTDHDTSGTNTASETHNTNKSPTSSASSSATSSTMNGPTATNSNTNTFISANNNSSLIGGSTSSSANPIPPFLSSPLPYTLTPSVIGPLPTENLLNNLTYLLVAPVEKQQLLIASNPPPPTNNSSSHSTTSTGVQQLSKQEMGILPMNISPAAMPPIGKKAAVMTVQAQSAFSHPYASIPSTMELASTAIQPTIIDMPSHLTNDALADWRKKSIAEYDLDAAEKYMREHQSLLFDWSKRKSALVTELYDQVDSLCKKSEFAWKKQDSKLRRGAFEVPPTPIDRRRIQQTIQNAPTSSNNNTPSSTTASSPSASSSSSSSSSPSSSSSSSSTSTSSLSSADSRKRSYTTMLQEIESREIQYSLQNELRVEIEKQSSSALGHSVHVAPNPLNPSNPSHSPSGASIATVEPPEPVYCICKKVSFGAMVACDNEDCEIEWFHFSCVGLDTKPRGKWLCADCINKKKKKKTSHDKEKEKEKEKDKDKDKDKDHDKDSSDKPLKEEKSETKKEKSESKSKKEKDKDKEKEKDKSDHKEKEKENKDKKDKDKDKDKEKH